jgi:hypothetical protein
MAWFGLAMVTSTGIPKTPPSALTVKGQLKDICPCSVHSLKLQKPNSIFYIDMRLKPLGEF